MLSNDFLESELKKWMSDDVNSVIYDMAKALFKTGCKVIDLARAKTKSEGGFGDIVWNLRGSIGCLLVINHHIPDEFIYSPSVSKGSEGR
ncbi:hypothetical protein [Pedobacter alluvionis]|uniref:Uncharacterized protein n=1 Tax=Pedobacter alluvionis TaxID=475253 RepID=A0A497Y9G1_9SPHI|nr:hypothetical protein [Pedobacter alluvionis]RLJ80204.1 hypothetical protein BCL90_0952 [Pedobacter alluvionis]TFB31487.1 hypothetical protein E3V97_12905 [Pedobacter alluvionis]